MIAKQVRPELRDSKTKSLIDYGSGTGLVSLELAGLLKAVMYKGQGLSDVFGDLVALAIFALVFIFLNILALKRYRKL